VTTSLTRTENPLSQLFSQFLRTWNYRPVTSWDDFFNPQFIVNSNSGDVALENDVLAEVGSYGKQLGTIMDALSVVISAVNLDDLLPADKQAIDRFRTLTKQVDEVVAQHRPTTDQTLTTSEVTDFLERFQALGRDDPAAARAVGKQLTEAVGGLSDATPPGTGRNAVRDNGEGAAHPSE